MKLTLRDLFWLVLLAAALVALGMEHRRLAADLQKQRQASQYLLNRPSPQPSADAIARREALSKLRAMKDNELEQRLADLTPKWIAGQDVEYEPCLTELARRGMASPLLEHYDELSQSKGSSYFHPQNLPALTAARRAEKLPDPLELKVTIPIEQKTNEGPAPTIRATITNVDARRKAPSFQMGGDYRGGRLERWRVVLTDARGQSVRDSNFASMIGGGISSYGPLEYGQRTDWNYDFDLRRYAAPPRSGKYQLQVFYHNDRSIAGEPDLTGLVVCQSQPVWIEVTNPNDPREIAWPAGLSTLLALAGASALVLVAAAWSRSRLSWRDWVWCGVVVIAGLGYFADCQYHQRALAELIPDAQAKWSIAPCESVRTQR